MVLGLCCSPLVLALTQAGDTTGWAGGEGQGETTSILKEQENRMKEGHGVQRWGDPRQC